jgi:NAD(P)-dependent dehydrogenase (short-subunit alcohol dehydrogenase family)
MADTQVIYKIMQLEPNQTLVITVLTGVVNYKQLMYGGMRAAAQKNWCVPGYSTYAATKAGVRAMTRNLAPEFTTE